MVDARKTRIGSGGLEGVLQGVSSVVIAKGKKFETFHLKKDPGCRTEALEKMIGPTGNLRAPTMRRRSRVIVGFNPEALEGFLG